MATELKHGQILERLVRRDRMGISELSRKLNVSRRTVYNWFGQDRLHHEVIWQVGSLLGQDLSESFPNVFPKSDTSQQIFSEHEGKQSTAGSSSVYFWMNKYISLLEKYNDLLSVSEQLPEEAEPIIKNLTPRNRKAEGFAYQ